MGTSARAEILSRIRTANGNTGALSNESTVSVNMANAQSAATHWSNLPREYRRGSARNPGKPPSLLQEQSLLLPHDQLLALLIDRLRDYDARVVQAQSGQIAQTVAKLLEARGNHRMVIPSGLDPQHLPPGLDFIVDTNLTAAEIDACDGVLTHSTLAIAETGTIVLQNVPGQGRRTVTLLPDYHLCLLDAAKVVETVPEAMAFLGPTAALATTFISGPSATADIEMIRIKGVHGPRFLDVVLFQ